MCFNMMQWQYILVALVKAKTQTPKATRTTGERTQRRPLEWLTGKIRRSSAKFGPWADSEEHRN